MGSNPPRHCGSMRAYVPEVQRPYLRDHHPEVAQAIGIQGQSQITSERKLAVGHVAFRDYSRQPARGHQPARKSTPRV
jgi:hypothetical protein